MAYRIISHEVHPTDGTYNAIFTDFGGSWSNLIGRGDTLDLKVDIGGSPSSVTLSHRFISNLNLVAGMGVDINMNGGVWRGTLTSTYVGVSLHGTGTWLNQHAEITGGRTTMILPETVALGGVGDLRITHAARMEFIGDVGAGQAVDLATNGYAIIDHLATFLGSVHLVGEFEHITLRGTVADNWMITDLPGPIDRLDFFHGAAYAGSLRLASDAAPHVTLTAPGVIDITGVTLGGVTPLAQMIVRHAMKHGDTDDKAAGTLLAARCFEVTQVGELIDDLVRSKFNPTNERITNFLPAPVTWIERKYDWGRHGALLHSARLLPDAKITSVLKELDDLDGIAIRQISYDREKDELGAFPTIGILFCDDVNIAAPLEQKQDDETEEEADARYKEGGAFARSIMAALAVVNSPRVIGRREHKPHTGLQRELGRHHKLGTKLPMESWTEIVLEVTPVAGGVGHDGVLTGKRALHFCRAHLRMRLGRVELVTSHWRGDPAIGIRRGRYTVVPQKSREGHNAV